MVSTRVCLKLRGRKGIGFGGCDGVRALAVAKPMYCKRIQPRMPSVWWWLLAEWHSVQHQPP